MWWSATYQYIVIHPRHVAHDENSWGVPSGTCYMAASELLYFPSMYPCASNDRRELFSNSRGISLYYTDATLHVLIFQPFILKSFCALLVARKSVEMLLQLMFEGQIEHNDLGFDASNFSTISQNPRGSLDRQGETNVWKRNCSTGIWPIWTLFYSLPPFSHPPRHML